MFGVIDIELRCSIEITAEIYFKYSFSFKRNSLTWTPKWTQIVFLFSPLYKHIIPAKFQNYWNIYCDLIQEACVIDHVSGSMDSRGLYILSEFL